MLNVHISKQKVQVDFTGRDIPPHVSNFMPDIYKQGKTFYCSLSGSVVDPIMAKGKSIEEAMTNWERLYKKERTRYELIF
ncbi:MAG: hypothetical protein QM802_20885 [Agriterribacter sp.]